MALLQLHFGGFARSFNFEVKNKTVEAETALPEDHGLYGLDYHVLLFCTHCQKIPDKSIVRINNGELIC